MSTPEQCSLNMENELSLRFRKWNVLRFWGEDIRKHTDDCGRQMKAFSEELGMTLRWQMKFLPFTDLRNIADNAGLMICIDMITDGRNRFITYSNGRFETSISGSM